MHFDEELILKEVEAGTNKEILLKMAENLESKGLVKESYKKAVIEREEAFATGLPTISYSVAIPHTDVEHVNKKSISVSVLKEPVAFGIMGEESDTTPVKIVFMLAMDKKHDQLDLLKRLMQLFADPKTLDLIVNEPNKTTIKDHILSLLHLSHEGGEN